LPGTLKDWGFNPNLGGCVADDYTLARRLPPEIKLELLSAQDSFMPTITEIVDAAGTPDGKPEDWSKSLRKYLADGDAMILGARVGRALVGFMVLEPASESATFSWVAENMRHRGLGQRFYSFACINLAMPKPQFIFPKDLMDEYRPVMRQQGLSPTLKDTYYVVHERPAAEAA
jgi:hypothetical protein